MQALLRLIEDEIPTNGIAREAAKLCRDISPDWLHAHCHRTYLIGSLLGRGLCFNPETFFVASMLHDVGLTATFEQGSVTGCVPGRERKEAPCFAVRGAGVAQRLATINGCLPPQSDALAEAISLHLNVRVPRSRGVEAHLLNAASAFDVVRLRHRRLPRQLICSIEDRWPREDSFCHDMWSAWANESDMHGECRGAFLNRWGCFKHRLFKTCPPN